MAPEAALTTTLRSSEHGLSWQCGSWRVEFTNRHGGVSTGPYASCNLGLHVGDDPTAVEQNRSRLASRIGRPSTFVNQVHGTGIVAASDAAVAQLDADAIVMSADDDLAAAVLIADCLPIAIVGSTGAAIVHAGWRSLAAGILDNACAVVGAPRAAAIGPGIGPCCFEVGTDVRDVFTVHAIATPGRVTVDLVAAATVRLQAAGIDQVDAASVCTACSPAYFSHRRDGTTGRQAGVLWQER